MRGWLKQNAPIVILCVGVAILFHRLLLGEVIFWGTPTTQFYPWREMAFSMLRQGQLPLWNPYVGLGAPLLANYQTAVLYPPNWLNLILPTEYAMSLIPLAHIIWAGVGMALFLRQQGTSQLGQTVGAVAFALSGYLVARFHFISMPMTIAWMPWIMWALVRERTFLPLAASVGMMLLAGHAQSAFYILLFAGAFVLWRNLRTAQPFATPRIWLIPLGGVLVGALIAAVQLAPTAELLLQSSRSAGVSTEEALTISFWPLRFLSFLMPNFFGTPARGNYAGLTPYWEDAIFVGVLPLILALVALRRRGDALFLWGSVIVSMVFALGRFTPIFPFLYENVPTFNLFRGVTRWSIIAVFALCWLAALGAERWQSADNRKAHERLTVAGLGFVIASGASFFLIADAGRLVVFNTALMRLGITLAVIGGLGLWRLQEGPKRGWQVAVGAFVALELITAHWGLVPTIQASYYHTTPPLVEVIGERRYIIYSADNTTVRFEQLLDINDYTNRSPAEWQVFRSSMVANIGQTYGVPIANNDDPLLVGPYADALTRLEDLPTDAARAEVVQTWGVAVVLQPEGEGVLSPQPLPQPWPRASFANCTAQQCTPNDARRVTIEAESPGSLRLSVGEGPAGNLLLLDTTYPGWQATVNGAPVPIEQVNGFFRMVELPAEAQTVEFTYRPVSLRIGAGLSVLGLLIIVGYEGVRRTHGRG